MSAPASSTASVLGRVTLVTGKQEFLNERSIARVLATVKKIDAEAEHTELPARELGPGSLEELSAPSLFSATRCVVLRGIESLADDAAAALLQFAADPPPDVALVLLHGGGPAGSGTLAKLRKLPAVTELKSEDLRPSEVPAFVRNEVRDHGATIEPEAAAYLVQAVGQDLRSLSAAAAQLASDFAGKRLGVDEVKRYFGGRAEAKSFDVSDLALAGRREQALEELRWALDGGVPPVLVTSALAAGVRGLARYKTAPKGRSEADLARDIGVPPWKVRTVRDQSRAWSEEGLAGAIRAVAQADADIKGAAADAPYTLERLVLSLGALRNQR